MTPAIADTLALIRQALTTHRYRVRNEADLQDQLAKVLAGSLDPVVAGLEISREVVSSSGRYDLQVRMMPPARERALIEGPPGVLTGVWFYDAAELKPLATVVLELKTRCAAAAVERQAQRYAMTHGVDAVCVVTTSPRLARQLADLSELGGKPFAVIELRSW